MTDPADKSKMVRRYLAGAHRQEARAEREGLKKQRQARREHQRPARRDEPRVDEPWDEDFIRERRPGKKKRKKNEARGARVHGTVVAIRRSETEVQTQDGAVQVSRLRPIPDTLAIGDSVAWESLGDEIRIVEVEPRRSTLSRPDPGNPHVQRILAANVDLAVVVSAAAEPDFKPGLFDRYLLALDVGGVAPVLCVNKWDLVSPAEGAAIDAALDAYQDLGIPVFRTSAATGVGVDALAARLRGRTVVFTGHSGVGKSALLNALDPTHERPTGSGRAFDGKGRHTTTGSSLHTLADGTRVIDTPGIREFGLWDLDREALRLRFPGLEEFARRCRFTDCSHVEEPECAVRQAVADGRLRDSRYEAYCRLREELKDAPPR